jgi:hypothetical protein
MCKITMLSVDPQFQLSNHFTHFHKIGWFEHYFIGASPVSCIVCDFLIFVITTWMHELVRW